MSSIVRQLDASRRLEEELAVEKHRQELEKQKIERELEGLRRSRKEYIDGQIQTSQKDYENRLRENPDIAEEHYERKKRVEKERSKDAQKDFETQRCRLLEERNSHDALDREYRELDKALLDVQARSKFANEQEERRLKDLENRRKLVVRLLDESKKRELDHFDRAKAIAATK